MKQFLVSFEERDQVIRQWLKTAKRRSVRWVTTLRWPCVTEEPNIADYFRQRFAQVTACRSIRCVKRSS